MLDRVVRYILSKSISTNISVSIYISTNTSVSIFMIFIEAYFIYMLVTYATDNKNTEATTVDISSPGDKYD